MKTKLTTWQERALLYLLHSKNEQTCTTVGCLLTGRKSSYGPQTSAREGGRTLRALLKRGLVSYRDGADGLHRYWELTAEGTRVASMLKYASEDPNVEAEET